jgi:hypothetical protein
MATPTNALSRTFIASSPAARGYAPSIDAIPLPAIVENT